MSRQAQTTNSSASPREAELQRVETLLLEALGTLTRVRAEVAGVLPAVADWVHVAEAAHRLGVSETTAWRHARRVGADWPQPGVRRINYEKLKRMRPPRAEIAGKMPDLPNDES